MVITMGQFMEFKLNIFTLNCWGIPGISKNRKERLEAIGKYLSESTHNIVCLQEIWSEHDYLQLKYTLKASLPYSHFFYSGVLGSGLCVFSKWLIQDVFFHQWPLNGYIHKINHGDWFGGKGIGLCRIRCGERLINVYCAHLHAVYHEVDIYLSHRMLQAHDTAELVYLTSEPADVSILAGDLNAVPTDIAFKLMSHLPALLDPYDMACEDSNPAVRKASGTSNNANNSYSDLKLAKQNPDGQRIDHILFKTGAAWEPTIESFGNPLQDRIPGKPFSYSDHNAVALELLLKHTTAKKPQQCLRQLSTDENLDRTMSHAMKICKLTMPDLQDYKKLYILIALLILFTTMASVEYFPELILVHILKLPAFVLCLYYFMMGSIWTKIEVNSVKAAMSAMENFIQTRKQLKNEEALGKDG